MIHPKRLAEAFPKGIQQKGVMRGHLNLAHPSKEKFLFVLKTAGASEQTLKIAKESKCDMCVFLRNHQETILL